jgi:hypothetical protein
MAKLGFGREALSFSFYRLEPFAAIDGEVVEVLLNLKGHETTVQN